MKIGLDCQLVFVAHAPACARISPSIRVKIFVLKHIIYHNIHILETALPEIIIVIDEKFLLVMIVQGRSLFLMMIAIKSLVQVSANSDLAAVICFLR